MRSAARAAVLVWLTCAGGSVSTAQQPNAGGDRGNMPRLAGPPPGGSLSWPRLLRDGTIPIWPETSRASKEEGTVEISVDLDDKGVAWRVMLMESSGYPALDEATIAWAKSIKFAPAKMGDRDTAFRDFRIRYEWKVDGPPRIITEPFAR